jgi:hypothetical protein
MVINTRTAKEAGTESARALSGAMALGSFSDELGMPHYIVGAAFVRNATFS